MYQEKKKTFLQKKYFKKISSHNKTTSIINSLQKISFVPLRKYWNLKSSDGRTKLHQGK